MQDDQQPAQAAPMAPAAGSNTMMFVAIGVIIVAVAAVGGYFLFIHSPSTSLPTTSTSASNSTSGSQSGSNPLLESLSSNNKPTFQTVTDVAMHGLNGTPELSVAYSGAASIGIKSSAAGSLTFSIPVTISLQRYYNNSRTEINASGIPLLGNLSIISISLSNKTAYTCISSSSTLFSNSTSAEGYQCTKSMSKGALDDGLSLSQEASVNVSAFNNTKVNYEGLKTFNGQPCYLIEVNGTENSSASTNASAGTLSVPSSLSTTGSYKYKISTCLSENYYIPLNLSMSLDAASKNATFGSILIGLNETSLGQSTSLSEVTTLPGPIVNSSSSNLNIGGSTGTTTVSNYSYSGGNYTCAPLNRFYNCSIVQGNPVTNGSVYYYAGGVSGVRNGTFINMWLGQDTGQTWNNANITFVPTGSQLNVSGVPEVAFNASDSINILTLNSNPSSFSVLVLNLPVSQRTSGSFSGTMWAKYYTDSAVRAQYAEMARINGTTT